MTRQPLTICAIGSAESVHVAARTRCFADRGHNVYLITDKKSSKGIPRVRELVPAQLPAGRLGNLLRATLEIPLLGKSIKHLWRAASFIRLLRRCAPDVVHVHYAYSYYGWLAGLVGCRPLVVSVMGGDVLFDEQGTPSALGKWLTLQLLEQADYITAKSDHLLDVLDRLGGFAAKAERIVWGMSFRQFQPVDASQLRGHLGLHEGQKVVFSPKILQPFYRVELVVAAMATVVAQLPNTVLLIAEYGADPDYRERIRTIVRGLALERHVRFCGSISYPDMPAYYSLADVTVAVPPSDGLPQTLLEAMACGSPNLLTHLPRYREIVEHKTSAYFVEANADAIASGIIELLTEPELAKRIAANALSIVRKQANLEDQAARVEEKFRSLARIRRRAWRPTRIVQATAAYLRFAANRG